MNLISVRGHVFLLAAIVAAILACARGASANPCGSCPSGQCCDVVAGNACVPATGGPTHCLAPDGVCQAPGVPNCSCCDSSNTCVDSCPSGQCCDVVAGLVCVTASGPPTNCLAPDGVCQAPGVPNCSCCDSSNTCVDSCGSGTCMSGSCVFEDSSGAAGCSDGKDNDGDGLTDCADPDCAHTPPCGTVAPMMSHRVAIALILTLCTLGLLRLRRDHRRAR